MFLGETFLCGCGSCSDTECVAREFICCDAGFVEDCFKVLLEPESHGWMIGVVCEEWGFGRGTFVLQVVKKSMVRLDGSL